MTSPVAFAAVVSVFPEVSARTEAIISVSPEAFRVLRSARGVRSQIEGCSPGRRIGLSRNVARDTLDRAVISADRRRDRVDRIGNVRNIRGEMCAGARIIADPSCNSVGRIGSSRSVGRLLGISGSIDGGGS
jgi:hypothetical protein